MRKAIPLSFVLFVSAVPLQAQTHVGEIGRGESGSPAQLIIGRPIEPRFSVAPLHAGGTVVVAVALSEGLVLAADSRLTLTYANVSGYKIASDSTNKLFDLDGRHAIAAFGEAFILGRSVGSFVLDFRLERQKKGDKDIYEVSKKFLKYFGNFYDQQVRENKTEPQIGFLLAGYDEKGVGRIIELQFPSRGEALELYNTRDKQGAVWRGQIDVISRIVKGFDPRIGNLPVVMKLDEIQKKELGEQITGVEYAIPFQYLMLQDGVDLALSLVQATVDIQRFSYGTVGAPGAIPGVGGVVDVLAITPFELGWIRKKTLTVR